MKRKLLATPYLFWAIGFIILPLITIFVNALTDTNGQFTFANIAAIASPINRQALLFSLAIAAGSTVVCILLAYPAALALRALHLKSKSFMIFILILPMWMNFVLRILAWQMILSKNGILNFILQGIGLPASGISNTWVAMMIGMVYDFLPYMILPVYNAISDIDEDVIEAAKDLGAGNRNVFLRVILPLSMPGCVSGCIMVFVPAMTSFVIADLLGGGKLLLIGNIIEQEFTQAMNWHVGSGLSVALMLLVLLGLAFSGKNESKKGESALW